MHRWVYFTFCLVIGIIASVCAWLMPAHLRAIDEVVLQQAGQATPGLVEQGLALARAQKTGAATFLAETARQEGFLDVQQLRLALNDATRLNPEIQTFGVTDPRLEFIFRPSAPSTRRSATSNASGSARSASGSEPITDFLVRLENREKALNALRNSPYPAVKELFWVEGLTNTVLFPSPQSASAQPFETALALCGLLLQGQHLTQGLTTTLSSTASAALRGQNSQPFEQILLDFMSLGQRMNWGQLRDFAKNIEDPETLRLLANIVRKSERDVAMIFSAVEMSGKPAGVAAYLMKFGQTGRTDLGKALRYGTGAVHELLSRAQPVYSSPWHRHLATELCWRMPRLALTLKWLLFLAAGFLLGVALEFAGKSEGGTSAAWGMRGFYLVRELLIGLVFLLVVLVLSEPFLAQESQNVEFPIRVRLPTVGSPVMAGKNVGANRTIMNQLSLLTLVLFFVLQGLIYIACLLKLAEIRRQTFPARVRLKLLENEEHLFDAGLYLGFAGTIISLILVSMGVIKPSLMAAYSSTSFGIIFVSIFKIFHLRPLRRKLLIEAETARPLGQEQSPHTLSAPL